MFKRYVIGYLSDNNFRPFNKSNNLIDLVNFAIEFNKCNATGVRLVVFDRREKIYVYN